MEWRERVAEGGTRGAEDGDARETYIRPRKSTQEGETGTGQTWLGLGPEKKGETRGRRFGRVMSAGGNGPGKDFAAGMGRRRGCGKRRNKWGGSS